MRRKLSAALLETGDALEDALEEAFSESPGEINVQEPPWQETVPLGEVRWWVLTGV